MKWFYFTFGSDEQFPYPNRFMKVKALSKTHAISIFRTYYPDREPESRIYNAADSYTQGEWDDFAGKYYADQEPAAIVDYES